MNSLDNMNKIDNIKRKILNGNFLTNKEIEFFYYNVDAFDMQKIQHKWVNLMAYIFKIDDRFFQLNRDEGFNFCNQIFEVTMEEKEITYIGRIYNKK